MVGDERHEQVLRRSRKLRAEAERLRAETVEIRRRSRELAALLADAGPAGPAAQSRFSQLPVPAALLDGDGRIVDVNAAWRARPELTGGASRGDRFAAAWTESLGDDFLERSAGEVARTATPLHAEVTLPGPGARRVLVELGPTARSGVLAVVVDVTGQYRREQELLFDATHDPLTGVANRAWIEQAVGEAVDRLRRYAEPYALVYLDLDGFKRFNDEHGHAFGDRVLRAVAQRWREAVRGGDLLARVGGDEFVVVAPRVAGLDEARVVAGRLARSLSRPLLVDGHAVEVSASAGVVIPPADAEPDEALALADRAMYETKRRRRQE